MKRLFIEDVKQGMVIADLYNSAFRRVSSDYIQGRMNDNMVETDKMVDLSRDKTTFNTDIINY